MPKTRNYNAQAETMSKMIAVALAEKDWTQAHLAKLCDISESQMSVIIKRPDRCNFSTLLIVFKKLGIKNIPICSP